MNEYTIFGTETGSVKLSEPETSQCSVLTVLSIFKDRNHQVQLSRKTHSMSASQIPMFPLCSQTEGSADYCLVSATFFTTITRALQNRLQQSSVIKTSS